MTQDEVRETSHISERTYSDASARVRSGDVRRAPDLVHFGAMSGQAWELLFMMLVLKIPLIYLGIVVWYAIKAEPEPGVDPSEYSLWRPWKKPEGPRPRRGGPARHARLRPGRARPAR